MERRSFLQRATVGATAGAAIAAPAIVHAQPTVRWRIASSFPKSLDALFGASETISKRVSEMSGGKFTISAHAAGEIVPGLQVLDAVQAGTIEMGHTALYYYFGKEPTWAFATAVPFGMNMRQFSAWWHQGGGEQLFNEFAGKSGIHAFMAGNTGAQMGGWFRKEIKSLEDLQGLKFRIAGLAGQVLAKLGVVPQQLAGGDVYPALEKGTIDATEFTVPYDDEKLGLQKVARYYYYPGFWEGGAAVHGIVNQKAFAALPPEYQAMVKAACEEAHAWVSSRYDAGNPAALKRLIAGGPVLRPFQREMLDASYKATQEVYAEHSSKSADFKKIHDHYFEFLRDQVAWFRVNEDTFSSYMASVRR